MPRHKIHAIEATVNAMHMNAILPECITSINTNTLQYKMKTFTALSIKSVISLFYNNRNLFERNPRKHFFIIKCYTNINQVIALFL